MASNSTSVDSSTSVDPSASSTPAPSGTSFSPPGTFTQSVPPDNGETNILDDTDPSITYTGSATIPWNVTSDTTAYNHTTHETSCNSCPATVLFNGTGLSLTSIISSVGSNFVVWVDGTQAGPFSLQNNIESSASVYSIEGLQNLQHNATFMKSSNDPNDPAMFNIDSITIISRPTTGGSSSYVPPTASGRTSTAGSQTGASPTETNAPVASESSPPPIGAIVGGTIGGVALILVVVAWIIIMRRRRAAANAPAYTGERYAQDRYAQDAYAAQGARRSADRRSGEKYTERRSGERPAEKYRSGYTDPRYAQGYTSSNNGYSRGPSSRAASRY